MSASAPSTKNLGATTDGARRTEDGEQEAARFASACSPPTRPSSRRGESMLVEAAVAILACVAFRVPC